jgi:hypothetical protein
VHERWICRHERKRCKQAARPLDDHLDFPRIAPAALAAALDEGDSTHARKNAEAAFFGAVSRRKSVISGFLWQEEHRKV